ncbi:Fatty acid hydroxylase superfamily protein [Filimonas lacunae]|uniref:Fatty acid hydroxylase superfamily protein n=1 Tax=Filimonas lacunae TaxID=477680 RepID=A0A173MMK7_9BACT|nr:sterol desaturase family protein [Filimonas lacunae]BAV08716.1 fatty acid hydroxylase-like protein [Filimonas lacunae]SIS60480.1 Fatty acid hydroxylase superfamily protein [Filimonas lacunae]
MSKNYVSNSTESVRMFKNSLMEGLSKVHFTIPLFIFIPIIGVFVYLSFHEGANILSFIGYFAFGLGIWTITEYVLHRWIFHYVPKAQWALRLHFIFHGVHHDYPRDKKRLVMPPSASLPLATLFYFLFSLCFEVKANLFAFFPGFLLGYLIYDMLHYAMHHYNFKSGLMKRIKQHHMLHHYQDAEKGFGVSSAIWDKIFHSDFTNKM